MIYLDNAATTFPKPMDVLRRTEDCLTEFCGNPGRAGHYLSRRASEEVCACREEIASFFGSERPENVVFTVNATEALNLALYGILRPGDHVLLSGIEHNAVLRAVHALLREGVTYSVYEASADPGTVLRSIRRHLRRNTRAVVACHASNICGLILPVREIGAFCAENRLRFVIDASQSAGKLRLDVNECRADAICAPGHKGLYGPPGVGFALFGERYAGGGAEKLRPLLSGGSGTTSREREMPPFLPERLEAGTLPLPAIAGLAAGLRAVRGIGPERIRAYEGSLSGRAAKELSGCPGVTVYCRENAAENGILLFNVGDRESEEIAEKLDERGICVRAGLHCAPLAHRTVGTGARGAVRASFSVYNTEEDVTALCHAVREIAERSKET